MSTSDSSSLAGWKDWLKNEPLDREEVVRLFRKAHKGDTDAREKLIMHNCRLVWREASRLRRKSLIPFEDLLSEGMLSLISSVDLFDLDVGVQFSTYAVQAIRRSIRRAIVGDRGAGFLARPRHNAGDVVRLTHEMARLSMSLDRDATALELAEALGWSEKRVLTITKKFKNSLSFGELDGDVTATGDNDMERAGWRMDFDIIMDKLPEQQHQFLKLWLGWDDGVALTAPEIARQFNVSRQWTHRQIVNALEVLRDGLTNDSVSD